MHDPKMLGENIRKYRKLLGLTQSELADKLYITAQNISKWELGQSMPDISNLCLLSELFDVSVDRLLGATDEEYNGRVMIALDGGGTKTEFVLFTEEGEILARQLREGSNPNSCGMDASLATLKSGIDALVTRDPNAVAIYGGIAGCALKENRRAVLAFLKKNYPGMKIDIRSDILNVIYSTEYFERCIAAITGTGSVVYAKNGDMLRRFGGWGYRFDRGCSGFDFGRDAITAALADEDCVGDHTLITKILQAHLEGRVSDKIDVLYACKNDKIASYADVVFEAYEQGDAVAEKILTDNVGRLLHLLKNASLQCDCGNKVIIAGGLTARKDILLQFLQRSDIDFEYIFPTLSPIYGAAAYCNRMFGEPKAEFAANFEKNYLYAKGIHHA